MREGGGQRKTGQSEAGRLETGQCEAGQCEAGQHGARRWDAGSRNVILREMDNKPFDVLVIGGGITGAGIALDAQTRGLRTALIDMQDFAAGTSSRSTKLVHGGLRYLKQLDVRTVTEVGRERAIVYENGPHVTTPERMLLPLYKGGTFGPRATALGLWIYDRLAGVKHSERRQMLTRDETMRREPLLKTDGLLGGGYYVEYRTDDARLTIEVLKKAVEAGTKAVNYVQAERLLYEAGQLVGVRVRDRIDGTEAVIRSRRIVNATGPWADGLRGQDDPRSGKTVRLTKGVHLVFDGLRFPLRQAVYFDTPDGRMVFAIPRAGKTYVGTTDTDYAGDIAHPSTSEADLSYLLRAANDMFPDLRLAAQDVESSWAGLRPLVSQQGKSPSDVSRRDEVFVSPSGLVTIAGGKLTGYRKMAEAVVDRLVDGLRPQAGRNAPFGPCVTKSLPISGGNFADRNGSVGSAAFAAVSQAQAADGVRAGLSPEAARSLALRYGSNAAAVFRIAASAVNEPSDSRFGLPLELYASLLYAVEHEMAATPSDFWIRRTGDLYFDIRRVRRWSDAVLEAMAARLHYSDDRKRQCETDLQRALGAASSPSPE